MSAPESKARDTIFALASGAPASAIAVIRVSGDDAGAGLAALVGSLPEPRRAALMTVRDPADGEMVDRGLVLWFPGPASFTGEDSFELHLHGGRAVIAAAMMVLGALAGFRPAEAGEFTRRSFVAGRMDLTEAEGLADLIDADTDGQRRAAIQQMGGSIRKQYELWAAEIVRARALLEAELDFSEEDGVSGAWVADGRSRLALVKSQMEAALSGFEGARMIREGIDVMILGPVNAGKSTLLNAVAGRDVVIVSAEPGTTRDLVEVTTELGGRKVTFVDGAGLRETESAIESEGVRRAQGRAKLADLVLWVSTGDIDPPSDLGTGDRVWRLAGKADMIDPIALTGLRADGWVPVSGLTGVGLDVLLRRIGDWASRHTAGENAAVTRERHRVALVQSVERVGRAEETDALEVAAEELRLASEGLGRVTGRTDVEDVLDVVFSQFCIGK